MYETHARCMCQIYMQYAHSSCIRTRLTTRRDRMNPTLQVHYNCRPALPWEVEGSGGLGAGRALMTNWRHPHTDPAMLTAGCCSKPLFTGGSPPRRCQTPIMSLLGWNGGCLAWTQRSSNPHLTPFGEKWWKDCAFYSLQPLEGRYNAKLHTPIHTYTKTRAEM